MQKSGFYNSLNGDRKYSADDFNEYFEGILSKGILPNVGDSFAVAPGSGMEVTISEGRAVDSSGHWFKLSAPITLELDPADVITSRNDIICIRFDNRLEKREVSVEVKKDVGNVLSSADGSSEIEELYLAKITIPKNTHTLTSANITDLRANNELCGYVCGLVNQIDTTMMYNSFNSWFDSVKGRFSQDFGMSSHSRHFTTDADNSAGFQIGMSGYDSATDTLMVFINGMKLVEGTEYINNGQTISLARSLNAGASVEIVVLENVVPN